MAQNGTPQRVMTEWELEQFEKIMEYCADTGRVGSDIGEKAAALVAEVRRLRAVVEDYRAAGLPTLAQGDPSAPTGQPGAQEDIPAIQHALLLNAAVELGLLLPTTPEAVARSEALPESGDAPAWLGDPAHFRKLLQQQAERMGQVGTTPDLVWAEGRWWCRHTNPVQGCKGCEADAQGGGR